MFEKPRLDVRGDDLSIQVAADQADQLLADLQQAGFAGELMEGELGGEDLNAGTRESVRVIELTKTTDQAAVRKFLRKWQNS